MFTKTKSEAKGGAPHRAPYKMLLFTALILPCANIFLLGSAMLVTSYFGAFYSYTAGGTVLTLLYELLSSAFNLIKHCLLIATVMTIGAHVFKKDLKSALLPALFAFLCGFSETIASSITLTVTVTAGISDSTAALPNQLIPLILSSVVSLLPRALLYALSLLAFFLFKNRSEDTRIVCYEKTPFALASLTSIALYASVLVANAVMLAIAPSESGNLFTNHILPFVYPIIYIGFMVLTLLVFPKYLRKYYKHKPIFTKKAKAPRAGKEGAAR